MSGDATQDRFLGAILGMAIGDAFGMPVAGLRAQTIIDVYGEVRGYLPRTFPDGEQVNPGEITDETEFALCIIESVTAGPGAVDVENIGIRMSYLARADSRRWMSPEVAANLDGPSETSGYRLPLNDDAPVGADVLARGIPIGLLHSMGPLHQEDLGRDSEAVARIAHASPLAISLVETVACAISLATRASTKLNELGTALQSQISSQSIRDGLAMREQSQLSAVAVIADALTIVGNTGTFADVLHDSVQLGGPADSRAALAGSIYAGHHGASVIPQRLIDELEVRIYVSLAVPWFYRKVARRSGRMLEMRRTVD